MSKQPHIPVYDYDHKFQFKQGYLRDDRVPAFISTKQNQMAKKELDLERVNSSDLTSGDRVIGLGKQSSMVSTGQPKKQKTIGGLGSNDNSPRSQ
jgi:hypothetical protein